METGIELIARARAKQLEKGWSLDHDKQHIFGELRQAAICFLETAYYEDIFDAKESIEYRKMWPFDTEFNPSSDMIENFAKAGALIAAEIDRLIGKKETSKKPEVDVNKRVITHAFLKCERCGKIVREMYGEKFNSIPRNKDRYLTFLKQVELDDRFGELAGILQRYGAMPEPKEQSNAGLEAEVDKYLVENYTNDTDVETPFLERMFSHDRNDLVQFARHFYELGLNTRKEEKI